MTTRPRPTAYCPAPPKGAPMDRQQRQFRQLSAHLFRRPMLAREAHVARLNQEANAKPTPTPLERMGLVTRTQSGIRPQWPKGARL